jgi:pimeloyl-ACP methyl ester carboxylesterase
MLDGVAPFTPSHRGGSGPPLVLLHGFLDTWRTWELVLPALECEHDVLALTLAGHAGGPPLKAPAGVATVADAVERAMDGAGIETADMAGNSLGGFVALVLAARGRARTVTAFAPAGGWAPGDRSVEALLDRQAQLHRQAKALAPQAGALLATREGRRRATHDLVERFEHIPVELLAQQLLAVAAAPGAEALLEAAARERWELDAARIACPVRIVWGTSDRLLPWPPAAARFQTEWLPQADRVELDDVGHCPQLDVPLEAAQLILGLSRSTRTRR